MKSVNSIENYFNLTFQTKLPYHLKAKIDNKLTVNLTIKKKINDSLYVSYGMGFNNLFQKKSRIQTGLVVDYNA